MGTDGYMWECTPPAVFSTRLKMALKRMGEQGMGVSLDGCLEQIRIFTETSQVWSR